MHKNLITPLLLICTLYFSCSKKGSQPAPQNGGSGNVKIELVSGNNQTDTIGRPLANPIVVKVTATNGASLSNYGLLYEGSGCNEDRLDQFNIGANGTTNYNWYLAGDVGQQTLKVFVVDAQNNKIDSVTAVGTGLSPGPGWHYSACTFPFAYTVAAFCKLSTGRLFTIMSDAKAYLRYSDDNGQSWNSVKGLGKTHPLLTIISTPADELFVVATDGNYFSKDAGQTWTSLPVQAFNTRAITGITYTASGKLLVTTTTDPIFISTDKGATWTALPITAFVPPNSSGGDSDFASPSEDQNGNLYLVGRESETIYKSTDNGKTWPVVTSSNHNDLSLYIDKNGWFYKYLNNGLTGGIYLSKDNGATYTQLTNSPNVFEENISVQSDGNLYYDITGVGLYRLNGISTPAKYIYVNDTPLLNPPYIVAKNNNLIVASSFQSLISYYKQ